MAHFNLLFLVLLSCSLTAYAQEYSILGKVKAEPAGEGLYGRVILEGTSYTTHTGEDGTFKLSNVPPGKYVIHIIVYGYQELEQNIHLHDKDLQVTYTLKPATLYMDSVVVRGNNVAGTGRAVLGEVEGTAIYAAKKTEVVVLKDIVANTSTNNTRQIYSKITGLNIWETDGAGIQLGIGSRGLNPNRVSNFNTRQNGYDISADALGYPESYYSPPAEAIEKIEIVRGASSLQYGTQFGGLVNFQLKKGMTGSPFRFTTRGTYGSFDFKNSFNSIEGTIGRLNYYSFYQYKGGDGWRPNSAFHVHTAYAGLEYQLSSKLSLSFQYTFMYYKARQPGGLTDDLFRKNPRLSVRDRNWFKVHWNLFAVDGNYIINEKIKANTRFFGLIADRSALGALGFIHRPDNMENRNLWVDRFMNFGNETRLLFGYRLGKQQSTFLIGTRVYYGNTWQKQGYSNNGSGGEKADFQFQGDDRSEYSQYVYPNSNFSLFAENIFKITSRLSVVPGVRAEHILTRADGLYTDFEYDLAGNPLTSQKVMKEKRESKRSFIIMGIGANYTLGDKAEIYANVSQNYRAINFNDMRINNPNLVIDPNLKDETGFTADLGARGNLSKILTYDVGVFAIHYNNRIGTTLDKVYLYRIRSNVAASTSQGVETFFDLDLWKWWKGDLARGRFALFSNCSYIHAVYTSSIEAGIKGRKVEMAPDLILKTGINFKYKKISSSVQYSYTAEQFTDATNTVKIPNAVSGIIPAYWVMDLSLNYTINKMADISASVNNFTDNRYFTRRADGYPGPGIIPSDAKSFFITLQLKLQ